MWVVIVLLATLVPKCYSRRRVQSEYGEGDSRSSANAHKPFARFLLASNARAVFDSPSVPSTRFHRSQHPRMRKTIARPRFTKLRMSEEENERSGQIGGARVLGFGSGALAGRELWDSLVMDGVVERVPIAKLPSKLEAQGFKLPDATSFQAPDLSSLSTPDASNLKLPDISGVKMPDMSGIKMPDMSSMKAPDLSGVKMPDMSGIKIPDVKMPDISGVKMPDMSDVKLPDISSLKIPDMNGLEVPDVSQAPDSNDVAELTSFNLPSFNLGPQPAFAADDIDISSINQQLSSIKTADLSSLSTPNLPDVDLSGVASAFEKVQDGLGPIAADVAASLGDTSGDLWVPFLCGLIGAYTFGAIAEREDALGFLMRALGGITDFTIKTISSVSFGAIVGFFIGALLGPINLVNTVSDAAQRSSKDKLDSVTQFPGKVVSSISESVSEKAASVTTAVNDVSKNTRGDSNS